MWGRFLMKDAWAGSASNQSACCWTDRKFRSFSIILTLVGSSDEVMNPAVLAKSEVPAGRFGLFLMNDGRELLASYQSVCTCMLMNELSFSNWLVHFGISDEVINPAVLGKSDVPGLFLMNSRLLGFLSFQSTWCDRARGGGGMCVCGGGGGGKNSGSLT